MNTGGKDKSSRACLRKIPGKSLRHQRDKRSTGRAMSERKQQEGSGTRQEKRAVKQGFQGGPSEKHPGKCRPEIADATIGRRNTRKQRATSRPERGDRGSIRYSRILTTGKCFRENRPGIKNPIPNISGWDFSWVFRYSPLPTITFA